MTPDRMRELLSRAGESQRGLARRLGCPERLARSWCAGRRPIPDDVAAWLERWVLWREAEPQPPTEWEHHHHDPG
jgi:hypothetical protein